MVFFPVLANIFARLTLVNVFPSPGACDVTKMVFNSDSTLIYFRFVLRFLNASEIFEFGISLVTMPSVS